MKWIDFRMWNKKYEFMDSPDLIDFSNKKVKYDSDWYNFDEIELMQWTGLYDKRKNKIYEGDLISAIWGDEIHIIGEVKQRIDGLQVIESINHNNQEFCVFHPNKMLKSLVIFMRMKIK